MNGTNGNDQHTIILKKESGDRWKGLLSSFDFNEAGHIKLDCSIDETVVSYEKWMYKSQLWFEQLLHK